MQFTATYKLRALMITLYHHISEYCVLNETELFYFKDNLCFSFFVYYIIGCCTVRSGGIYIRASSSQCVLFLL